ncbi:ATP-binding protein [Thiomicrorhabdus sp. Milos-T2]|uniref:ATP-binding protein n=1 Tax=Thiomicrorhabdus sp. Milos-T2 TaxID=90814 RepID=UPI00068DAB9C|nr:ATP-binding protein [Thiomicrorhabdus sp. Milos-T2]
MNTLETKNNSFQETLQKQQLLLVLENTLSSSLGNFGVALLITLIFNHFMDSALVYGWFFFMTVISTIRFFVGKYLYKKIKQGIYKSEYEMAIYIIVVLTGIGWGSAAVLFINEQNIQTNSYLAIAIAGIVAGSTASLISIKKLFFSFLITSLFPTFLIFLFVGGIENLYFSMMILFFILFMFKNGNVFSSNIAENVKLIHENKVLIKNLEIEKNHALQTSELKSQFLANMSHEIRTPMNAILGFIHLLKENEVDSKRISYFDSVIYSSENLLHIINNILDFSKIECNQLKIVKNSFNPTPLFKNTLQIFEDEANQKNIQLEFSCKESLPNKIIGDEFRLTQIISNLVSNAIKFSLENVNVILQASYNQKTGKLSVAVYDEGIGISKEKQQEIFESFYQVDSSTTRKFGGIGLGLSISSMLVKKMGGKLEVESVENKGSKFFFTIPAPVDQTTNIKPELAQKNITEFKPINGHILLVEDVLLNQKLMIAYLNKFGLTYEIAKDGLEAVQAFKNSEFSVILMDENMPNMSGIEATHEIRKIELLNNRQPIPIIAVTANALKDDKARFLAEGFNEYLPKPVNIKLLYQTLDKVIND